MRPGPRHRARAFAIPVAFALAFTSASGLATAAAAPARAEKAPAAAPDLLPVDGSWTRMGVVVASAKGLTGDRPLRFAYRDAERLGRMLAGVGQVESADLFVIKAEDHAGFRAQLARAGARVAALKAQGRKVFLQFYYSGHGGARQFHLADGPFAFDEVKAALGGESPDARVYVLDVCFGASFFNSKGFVTAPPVQLKMEMDPSARGEVTISSSSLEEQAYEVKTLGGSIFTSHWIMALRGAGDRNRDGQVTLFEAYSYAYDRTSGYSAEALDRPQHPSFQMDLTGARDVTLARLLRGTSGVRFQGCPAGLYNVIDLQKGLQVGELRLPPGEEFTLALEPGRYRVQYRPGRGNSQAADLDLSDAGLAPLPFSAFKEGLAEAGLPKGAGAPGDESAEGAPAGSAPPGEGPFLGEDADPPEPARVAAASAPRLRFHQRLGFSLSAGAARFRDARLESRLAKPSRFDQDFKISGAFEFPQWKGDFGFDANVFLFGPWFAGFRIGYSRTEFRQLAHGREQLGGLSEEEAAKYPVDLDWSLVFTDTRIGFSLGRSLYSGPSHAFSAEAGASILDRSAESDRTLSRPLYDRKATSYATAGGLGYRLEASVGYLARIGGIARRPLSLGARLTPYLISVPGFRDPSTDVNLAAHETGASLVFTLGLPSRALLTLDPAARRFP